MRRRRSDDHLVLHADVGWARTPRDRGSGRRTSARRAAGETRIRDDAIGVATTGNTAEARIRDDAVAASTNARLRNDAVAATVHARACEDATASTDGGRGRDVVLRSSVVLTRRGTADDIRRDRALVHVIMWTIHVMVVGVVVAERPTDRRAAVPVPTRRRGRPADVSVARRADAPRNPRTCVTTTGDPRPTMSGQHHPAAIMERSPSPRIVRDPDVVGRVAVRPMARRHIRLEFGADLRGRRNPDRAVRRIIDPRAVTFERGCELGERAWIRVRVLVFVRADQDLAVLRSLLTCLLLRCELSGGRRSGRDVVLTRVVGLFVSSTTHREESRRSNGRRPHARDPMRKPLTHGFSIVSNRCAVRYWRARRNFQRFFQGFCPQKRSPNWHFRGVAATTRQSAPPLLLLTPL
jgi:hypothetical protein